MIFFTKKGYSDFVTVATESDNIYIYYFFIRIVKDGREEYGIQGVD